MSSTSLTDCHHHSLKTASPLPSTCDRARLYIEWSAKSRRRGQANTDVSGRTATVVCTNAMADWSTLLTGNTVTLPCRFKYGISLILISLPLGLVSPLDKRRSILTHMCVVLLAIIDAKTNTCKSKKIKLELRQEGKSGTSALLSKAEFDVANYSAHELDTTVKIAMRGKTSTKSPLILAVYCVFL
jgi:hypothetical protein